MLSTLFRTLRQPPPWAIAMAGPWMFGALDVAATLTAGPERESLHHPLGVAARELLALVPGATAFGLFVLLKVLVVAACGLLAFAACTTTSPRRRHALLAGQLAAALAMDSLVFHLMVSAQLAMLLPLRTGRRWLAAQYALGVLLDGALIWTGPSQAREMGWSILVYLSLERLLIGAAFFVALLVLRERRSRVALAEAHAQVLATQTLLGETVRGAERMRIARDLHDTLGHHLTALTLHLTLAQRQAGAAAPAALGTAHDLGRELLAQVREVVSHSRHDQAIDLGEALRVLCRGLPAVRADLHIDAAAARHPPHVAHALFRCIQEAVTNVLRHARATRLSIRLEARDGATIVRVDDDGAGRPGFSEGNGLRGMRERLADLGGELLVGVRDGVTLEMRLPRHGDAA